MYSLEHIRQLGFRVTPQRQLVLDILFDRGGHATVNEVYQDACLRMPTINQATIYRVLDFFCELQVIARTEIGGRSVYEVVGERPHHHLVCRQCSQVAVLSDRHFEKLSEHLLSEHGFKAELNHMAISGLCAGCQSEAA